jgi:DNA-binding MurR/RpiR family transcriptional regulator
MLGHASAAMTLDTYAELFDEDLDAVATRLNQARTSAIVGKIGGQSDGTGIQTPPIRAITDK